MNRMWVLTLSLFATLTSAQYGGYIQPIEPFGYVATQNIPPGYQSYYSPILPAIPQFSYPKLPQQLGRAATCNIVSAADYKVSGQIQLYQTSDYEPVLVSGTIQGIARPGPHGLHLHRDGSIANNCVSSGPHFNPHNQTHGGPEDAVHHAGDFGNIIANEYGQATFELKGTQISLHPGDVGYAVGRAFVVHAGVDDLGKGDNEESLRTGNSGARLGCCVVEAVEY